MRELQMFWGIVHDLAGRGIKVRLSFTRAGYDPDDRTMRVALSSGSLDDLAYEYADLDRSAATDRAYERFEKWLDHGEEYEEKAIDRDLEEIMAWEIECHKTVVELFDHYEVSFDRSDYIRRANASVQTQKLRRAFRAYLEFSEASVAEFPDTFVNPRTLRTASPSKQLRA